MLGPRDGRGAPRCVSLEVQTEVEVRRSHCRAHVPVGLAMVAFAEPVTHGTCTASRSSQTRGAMRSRVSRYKATAGSGQTVDLPSHRAPIFYSGPSDGVLLLHLVPVNPADS